MNVTHPNDVLLFSHNNNLAIITSQQHFNFLPLIRQKHILSAVESVNSRNTKLFP